MNKQISQVALLSLLMLAALIGATTYWQTWAAGGLAARSDNTIQRVAEFEIKRGLIYASDGKTVLAGRRLVRKDGETFYYRRYPTDGFAAQTIGYWMQSESATGLEEAENSYLTSSNADLGTIVTKLGDTLRGATITGNNIVTTLNVKLQTIAESALRGKCGAVVALNPQTGGVYAMASSPTFDPNLIATTSGYRSIQATKSPCEPEGASPLFDRATEGLYPPGSIFKTVTAAAALDDGVYTPSSSFVDQGYCIDYGTKVKNALDQNGPEVYGTVNLVEAYEHSINAVFCNIGQKLGAARILAEAKKFGFYKTPPLETPANSRVASGLYTQTAPRKLLDPKNPDTSVDAGRLAFGQERMLVTPLQMAMVAATVANGGIEMQPTLIKKIVSPNGTTISKPGPHILRHVLKPTTAAALRNMMAQVVVGGTGTAAEIPGVFVGGKTGTAEIGDDPYYDAWFIFFSPATSQHPAIAGAVVVERQANGFGGAVAAPIARELIQALL